MWGSFWLVIFLVLIFFVMMVVVSELLIYMDDVCLFFVKYCVFCYWLEGFNMGGMVVLMVLMIFVEMRLWVKLIVCVVEVGEMLFWYVLFEYCGVFCNECVLLDEEWMILFVWVLVGVLCGEGDDVFLVIVLDDGEVIVWLIGVFDVVVMMFEFY